MNQNTFIEYNIDNNIYKVCVSGSSEFERGEHTIISNIETDLTFNQPWYSEGYTIEPFLTDNEFLMLYNSVENAIIHILQQKNINTNNFLLEKYHKYVTTDVLHQQVTSITRDLFSHNFDISIGNIIKKFEDIINAKLTNFNKATNQHIHFILRINRPGSTDFNPPHKDIYELWDNKSMFKFINIWIPICGVTEHSSLPLVPKSHLLPENLIIRTTKGGVINGNKYHVRTIKEWDNTNQLTRAKIQNNEVLLFSPCLIHGLAVNDQIDTTRVSFEFRLLPRS